MWHSRCNRIYPEDIQAKWEKATLIIGPVYINHNQDFVRMKSWKDVSEENVYVVRGEMGVQFVWIGTRAMADMNKAVEDKLDLFKCFHPKPRGSQPVIK